jgi:succinate dehydrogenase hydrophobic anchor subunit
MTSGVLKTGLESSIALRLERLPVLSLYVRTRGWPFVLSWSHRIAGLLLVAFVWYHIYSLTSLRTPSEYDAKMKIFGFFVFAFLEWALAIPVIFHAFNGGRLILYESFEKRNDESLIRWTIGLSILFVALLGLLMLMGNQAVSPFFFWLSMILVALTLAYGVASRLWKTDHSIFWKAQRISGAFLLIMAPAHLLFMHLNPSMAKEATAVIIRMQNYFIRAVDISLVVGALYHGGYGVVSTLGDYLPSGALRAALRVVTVGVMLIFALVGIRLILTI